MAVPRSVPLGPPRQGRIESRIYESLRPRLKDAEGGCLPHPLVPAKVMDLQKKLAEIKLSIKDYKNSPSKSFEEKVKDLIRLACLLNDGLSLRYEVQSVDRGPWAPDVDDDSALEMGLVHFKEHSDELLMNYPIGASLVWPREILAPQFQLYYDVMMDALNSRALALCDPSVKLLHMKKTNFQTGKLDMLYDYAQCIG